MAKAAAATLLNENENIKELISILRSKKMNSQLKDFTQMIGYVDTMEQQLNSVLGELNSVRKQLDEIKDKQHPVRTACMKMLNSLQASVNETKDKLTEVKNNIIEGAKNAVDAFKEKGISALNSVMSFFKVNDGLNAVRNSVNKSIASAEKSISKIEKMSNEIHAVGSHTRNIGRAMMGKETQQDVKTNGKIMKVVQSPFKANKATMSGVKKIVSAAIDKLEQLDKTVQQNREKSAAKAKKPSLLDNVKNFKPPARVIAEVGSDKSKKRKKVYSPLNL